MDKRMVAALAELQAEGHRLVESEGQEIGVYYVDGIVHAWRSVCPHRAARVCRGLVGGTHLPSEVYSYAFGLEGRILRCPYHGWEFDLTTGQLLVDPKVRLRRVPVIIENGEVYLVHGKTTSDRTQQQEGIW